MKLFKNLLLINVITIILTSTSYAINTLNEVINSSQNNAVVTVIGKLENITENSYAIVDKNKDVVTITVQDYLWASIGAKSPIMNKALQIMAIVIKDTDGSVNLEALKIELLNTDFEASAVEAASPFANSNNETANEEQNSPNQPSMENESSNMDQNNATEQQPNPNNNTNMAPQSSMDSTNNNSQNIQSTEQNTPNQEGNANTTTQDNMGNTPSQSNNNMESTPAQ